MLVHAYVELYVVSTLHQKGNLPSGACPSYVDPPSPPGAGLSPEPPAELFCCASPAALGLLGAPDLVPILGAAPLGRFSILGALVGGAAGFSVGASLISPSSCNGRLLLVLADAATAELACSVWLTARYCVSFALVQFESLARTYHSGLSLSFRQALHSDHEEPRPCLSLGELMTLVSHR